MFATHYNFQFENSKLRNLKESLYYIQTIFKYFYKIINYSYCFKSFKLKQLIK